MQASYIILKFPVATFKKVSNEQVKLISIIFYLTQNTFICNRYKK